MRAYPKDSGNVLFLILIAVALFAALSYVVVQSSRSGTGSTSRELDRLAVGDLFNYITAVQTGYLRLQTNGCKETEISFDNPADAAAAVAQGWAENYNNTNSPSDHSCEIFHPKGGAVIYKNVPKEWINSTNPEYQRFFYTSADILENVGTDCNDESCAELNINLWSITPNLCAAINEKLGYAALNAALPTASLFGCPFDGDFSCSGGSVNETFSDPQLRGKLMVCYNDTTYGPTFNAVLLAR